MSNVVAVGSLQASRTTAESNAADCSVCLKCPVPEGTVYMTGGMKGSGSRPYMVICPDCKQKVIDALLQV